MKCEVANDLLTLYVDDLCSPQTRKELEAHLKECPECEKKLRNYRKNLKTVMDTEATGASETTLAQTVAEIEPMKKVKKKMKKGKLKVIALSIVLLLVLGCLGMLSYGEATNLYPGFTVISDAIKIKSACKDLARGETEAFMDLLAYHLEDQYVLLATGSFEDMDAYMASMEENVLKAYEHYFKGRNVKVEVNSLFANPYDLMMSADDVESLIGIAFCEGDTTLYRMEFGKVAHNKYVVYENSDLTMAFDAPTFTGGMIPYDDIILKITLPYAAQSGYRNLVSGETQKMGGGLVLAVEKTEESETGAFNEQMREKMAKLVENGCYIKHVNYSMSDYNTESGRWIYNVWITYEDQHSGAIFVTEQKFIYHNNKMYVIEGEKPVMTSFSADTESIPPETMELALSMFQ